MASITSFPSGVSGSSLVLLSTITASSSAGISFTTNIDSTYKKYEIHFIDVHGSNDDENLQFNMTIDGTNWNVSKTTTYFVAYHNEAGNDTALTYETGRDLAQGTGFQNLNDRLGTDNDQCVAGVFHLFDPSNTTFVKHYISRSSAYQAPDYNKQAFSAGYGNTTSAVTGIQFKMSAGNIDSGTFKLYGVS
tara:strand:+ start:87 stop:659 length:573 start_codon:yes stop_codon:yes gene_type:complete